MRRTSMIVMQFRADFYFKVDDDVIVNVPALVAYLEPRRQHGNLYMVRPAAPKFA